MIIFFISAIFRSLLYEACGRIVNPIYGSVGLLWSGSWELCQAAVEAVLKGEPIKPIASETAENGQGPPFKAYDIRHVAKDDNLEETEQVRTWSRLRRTMKPRPMKEAGSSKEVNRSKSIVEAGLDEKVNPNRSESSLSQLGKETESGVSVETSILFHDEPESKAKVNGRAEEGVSDDVGLELRLGIEPLSREEHVVPIKKRKFMWKDCNVSCKVELGFKLSD